MNIQPEDTVGFVIAQTHRNIDAALTETLRRCCQIHNKPYEVTVAQWGLLYLLSQDDGLPIGMISQQRHVDAPVVTNVVTRLEHSGLVERRHDQQDRRVVKVYLTQEGREIMRVLPSAVEAFYQNLIRDISEQELQLVKGVLRHLVANVSPPPALHTSQDDFS